MSIPTVYSFNPNDFQTSDKKEPLVYPFSNIRALDAIFQDHLRYAAQMAVELSAQGMALAQHTEKSSQPMDKAGYHESAALENAQQTTRIGGPFGSVIFKFEVNDVAKTVSVQLLGKGRNKVMTCNDASHHGEIDAIRHAIANGHKHALKDAILVTSCAACPMCYARAQQEGLRMYYLNSPDDAHEIGFSDQEFWDLARRDFRDWPNVALADSDTQPFKFLKEDPYPNSKVIIFHLENEHDISFFTYSNAEIATSGEDPSILALQTFGAKTNHFHHSAYGIYVAGPIQLYALWALKWACFGKIVLNGPVVKGSFADKDEAYEVNMTNERLDMFPNELKAAKKVFETWKKKFCSLLIKAP